MVGCDEEQKVDLEHALVICEGNDGVGRGVLDCVSMYAAQTMTAEQALPLKFISEDVHELLNFWLLVVAWASMWEARLVGKRPELYRVRADLEAKVSLLCETRKHKEVAAKISLMLRFL